jgi:hypothetical protein
LFYFNKFAAEIVNLFIYIYYFFIYCFLEHLVTLIKLFNCTSFISYFHTYKRP